MFIEKIISFLVLYLLLNTNKINCDTEIKCSEEFCRRYVKDKGCPELSDECLAMNATHHGTFFDYPDVCNCCPYCLTNIGSGDNCIHGFPGLQPKAMSICESGLACTINKNGSYTCQPIKTTKCAKDQADWDERRANGLLGMLEVRPKCDSDGQFAPQYCIPGSICYCIDPNGERIFGEIPFLDSWDEQLMTCGCSLNDWKMRNTLDIEYFKKTQSVIVQGARCTENGLFDELQCMRGDEAKCFCVDSSTGHPITNLKDSVIISDITTGKPPCFDTSRHQAGSYETTCELMSLYSNQPPIYSINIFNQPTCQPDGMFDRVQTTESRKICVDPSGKQITHNGTEYGVDLSSTEAQKINCNCARNVWLLSKAGVAELPQCSENGNFEACQCRRNLCYCVDSNGAQISLEVNSNDQLSCSKKINSCPISI